LHHDNSLPGCETVWFGRCMLLPYSRSNPVFHPEDKGSHFLRNARTNVPNYTVRTSTTINKVFPLKQMIRSGICTSGSPTHGLRSGVARSMPTLPSCTCHSVKSLRVCLYIVSSDPIMGFPKTVYSHRALRSRLVWEVHCLTTGCSRCVDGHMR